MRVEKSNYSSSFIFPKPIKRIGIEVNQKCNLHCSYCWNAKWNNKEIDYNKVMSILQNIYLSTQYWDEKIVPVINFYAAEPLLSPKIVFGIMENIPFKYNILTNGTLISGENKEKLEKMKPHLIISMDGVQPNHDFYRGNSFNNVINNIIKYKYPHMISLGMTVNISTLEYLYDSLVYMLFLPVGSFECHLNLHENWTDELFHKYISILKQFIYDYKDKIYLPGHSLEKRFANYYNAKNYSIDGGGPVHQIDIDSNILIQKPQRSCLLTPDKKDLFYGKIFANSSGFLSETLKNEYNTFMTCQFSNYNYYSDNCENCDFQHKCQKNREKSVYLIHKECYSLLELFLLEEEFWKKSIMKI